VKPSFLLDEQISPRVAEQAAHQGVKIKAVCGSELAGRDDASILRAAIDEGRILITYTIADFTVVYSDLIKAGVKIPGLVFVNETSIPNSDIQGLVRALVKLSARIEEGEIDPGGCLFLT
jgi:predicted nuclease of predicted toxin-antitoxin system